MTNSSPWFFDGPNRNRWFTVLKNGWIFHGELLNHGIDGPNRNRWFTVLKNGWIFHGELLNHGIDGPNRNRWFTWVYLLKMGGFSMAIFNGYVK